LGQIGVISWDMGLGLFSLGSIAVLVNHQGMALSALPRETWKKLIFAGFLAGAAAGLKLTAAVFPFGIVIALFLTSAPSWKNRFARAILFSVGGGLGIAVFGGYWMFKLYQAYGNPMLPYFNDVFQSPYAVTGGNRDVTFLPGDFHTAILFPFLFTLNSRRVAEYNFRDTHIAAAFIVIVLAIVAAYILRRKGKVLFADGRVAAFLFTAFFVIFAAWEDLFSIYRYIIPLEMLGAVVVAVGIARLPLPGRTVPYAVIGMMAVMASLIQVGFNRRPWDSGKAYVEVNFPMSIPENSMVLMPGMSPLGFIVPSLPPSVPAIRVGSYLATGDAFEPLMVMRIAGHAGPFFVIYDPGEEAGVAPTLTHYNLVVDRASCGPITSNVLNPMVLCKVSR
jgi:hypothetical protein